MSLETVDYGVLRLFSGYTVASDPGPGQVLAGTVTVQPAAPNDQVPLNYFWVVTAITVAVVGSVGTKNIDCLVYDQDPSIESPAPISKTIAGVLDMNDTCRLVIRGGDGLYLTWSPVPAACRCKARVQYELVQATGAAATKLLMH